MLQRAATAALRHRAEGLDAIRTGADPFEHAAALALDFHFCAFARQQAGGEDGAWHDGISPCAEALGDQGFHMDGFGGGFATSVHNPANAGRELRGQAPSARRGVAPFMTIVFMSGSA